MLEQIRISVRAAISRIDDLSHRLCREWSKWYLYPRLNKWPNFKRILGKADSFGNAFSDKIIAYLTQHAAQLVKNQDTSSLYV